jgi:hypothetical protein
MMMAMNLPVPRQHEFLVHPTMKTTNHEVNYALIIFRNLLNN